MKYIDFLNNLAWEYVQSYFKENTSMKKNHINILDVACGTHTWDKFTGYHTVGIDPKGTSYDVITEKYQKASQYLHADIVFSKQFLEHLEFPGDYLEWAKKRAKKMVITILPNGDSINRQIGAMNGFLPSSLSLSQADKNVGHKIMYDIKKLRELFSQHFKVYSIIPCGWKPLPSAEMDMLDEKFYGQLAKYGRTRIKSCAWFIVLAYV